MGLSKDSLRMPQSITVLLVEDSPLDLAVMRERLALASSANRVLSPLVADSLAEGLGLASQGLVDVVLLDLGLPDSDGLPTLHAFLRDSPPVPVIVLTGLTDEEIAVEAVNCGAQDFLFKDQLDVRTLRRSIRYAMERYRLETEQRRLSAQLLTAIGDEQQRIAHELHDEVGQGLAGLNMMSQSLTRKLRQAGRPEAERARLISEGIQNVLDSFRHVLCGLSPVDIDQMGLQVALQRLCENIKSIGVDCVFHREAEASIRDNAMATHLYRIAQESLTNAIRHASAQHLSVKLEVGRGRVRLVIHDDGHGFDSSASHEQGMGLRILRHRSQLIGGSLAITSTSTGTVVSCEVPLYGSEDNS